MTYDIGKQLSAEGAYTLHAVIRQKGSPNGLPELMVWVGFVRGERVVSCFELIPRVDPEVLKEEALDSLKRYVEYPTTGCMVDPEKKHRFDGDPMDAHFEGACIDCGAFKPRHGSWPGEKVS